MKISLSPQALLFDMDGVLVDSLDSWWKSLNNALRRIKHETISKDQFIEEYWGFSLQENLEKLGIEMKNQEFCNYFYKKYVDNVKLFSDTKDILRKLESFPKAIITNTPAKCTKQILEKFDIKQYFDVVITSDQIEEGKPSPEMVFKACEQLEVNVEEVVLIGDTQNDVKAGRAVGCTTIGIQASSADFVIGHISKLDQIINTKINQ
ncbi:MAG: HAD family hydrolase [Candidatus Thermoplasmatota archaeon]|nr:HAD family hydrolase [Candidatus Thermoplasmatota archaeon]